MLIDNGLALNVYHLATLDKLKVVRTHLKLSATITQTIDGIERKVFHEINLTVEIGPTIAKIQQKKTKIWVPSLQMK